LQNAKLLADSVEALIGAFVVGGGERAGFSLLSQLNMATIPWDALKVAAAPPVADWEPFVDVQAIERILRYGLFT